MTVSFVEGFITCRGITSQLLCDRGEYCAPIKGGCLESLNSCLVFRSNNAFMWGVKNTRALFSTGDDSK